jgi:hypothetical protein
MGIFNAQFTTAGFTRIPMTTIISALEATWTSAGGADVDLVARSIDGQIIGVLSEMFDDLNGMAAMSLNIANPNGALATMLSNLAYLTGITRNAASYSTAAATFTGASGTVIPITAVVKSTIDETLWSPLAQVTIGSGGTVTGTLKCQTIGPPAGGSVPAGSLTDIITPITSPGAGWTAVTNDVGTPGYLQEGDPNLRVRRQQSTAIASQAMTDGLQAAIKGLKNLDGSSAGVVDAVVWENNTTSPLTIQIGSGATINPNTIRAIVQVTNGSAADPTYTTSFADPIAKAIFALKGMSCNTQGAISKAPEDSLGVAHPIHYDLATQIAVDIRISVARRTNWPTNGTAIIQAAIAKWANGSNSTTGKPNIQIGGDDQGKLSWTDVVGSFINEVPGFDLINLQFSSDGSTWTTSPNSLSVPFGGFVSISSVTVTEW